MLSPFDPNLENKMGVNTNPNIAANIRADQERWNIARDAVFGVNGLAYSGEFSNGKKQYVAFPEFASRVSEWLKTVNDDDRADMRGRVAVLAWQNINAYKPHLTATLHQVHPRYLRITIGKQQKGNVA